MQTTLRKLTLALPLAICLLLPARTRAETAVQAWVQRYSGGNARATAVAVDGSNNVIVTGVSLGGGSRSPYDYTTIKYSSAGVPVWTNRYDGGIVEGIDCAAAVAVDGSNDVIVTGYSEPVFFGGPANYATVKYSSAGVPLWTNRYAGELVAGSGYATALAVDGSNDVIVTGYSSGSGSLYDYATIKYSSAGAPVWTNRYNGTRNGAALASAVAVDGSNNVIVTGWSPGSAGGLDYATIKYSSAGIPLWTNLFEDAMAVAVDGSNSVIVTGSSRGFGNSYDYATIKYSSAGVALWTNRYNGPGNGNDYARAVAVDASNNVIVTGSSGPAGSTNYATVKYSNAGLPLWTNRYNGPGSTNDSACAVAVDGSNNVIVTGYSWGSGSSYDYATIKYSSAGVPLWTSRYNGPANANDYARAMAVDGSGNVIVTGYSAGSGSGYESATIKYVFPLVITDCKMAGGTLQMLADNLQPGTLVIEASTNLTGWTPVFTNTMPTNLVFYTDPDAGSLPTRFYRAFQFP